MSKAAEILAKSRKVVLKIGSNVLAGGNGVLDEERVRQIAGQALAMMRDGKRVVLVSSGAGVSGAALVGRLNRKDDMHYKQALCAVGQVELMMAYKKYFEEEGKHVGQILLTTENFEDDDSRLNIRNTLFTLLDEDVVPVINENDSVCTQEFSFGDNDNLAALTANLWSADLLIIMSDVDGVFESSPVENPGARLIEEVTDLGALDAKIVTGGVSSFGRGGMDSKLEAAKTVGAYGIPMLLVNGKRGDVLADVARGGRCTVFIP